MPKEATTRERQKSWGLVIFMLGSAVWIFVYGGMLYGETQFAESDYMTIVGIITAGALPLAIAITIIFRLGVEYGRSYAERAQGHRDITTCHFMNDTN
ncbi:hypothetical protein CL630_01445 [bacterium]|nr:hypothetical protein [bacterium]|tara:strand:- start:20147 stop:20440 length:294 start_codon:yes stop_codon:yes gene_type:complete